MRIFQMPWQLFAAAIGGLLASGCSSTDLLQPTLATYGDYDDFKHRTEIKNAPFYIHPLPIHIEELRKACQLNGNGETCTNSKHFRNFVQNELLRRSDQICEQYTTRVVYAYAAETIAAGTINGLLGTLKTLAAPGDFLTGLGAIGGGTLGALKSNSILQYEFFLSLNQKISKSRRIIRAALRAVQNKPPGKYALSQAIYDTERYHSYCNFATVLALEDKDLIADFELITWTGGTTGPQKNEPKPAPEPEKTEAPAKIIK